MFFGKLKNANANVFCRQLHSPLSVFYKNFSYHKRCRCKFLDNTDLTSAVKRNASNTGSKFSNAMSVGSENHDFIGIALSEKKIMKYSND